MKRFGICLLTILLIVSAGSVFAKSSNAWQMASGISGTWAIDLPVESADISIDNSDSTYGVWVNVHNSTMTSCDYGVQGCYFLAPSSSLDVYDYRTSGITIMKDNIAASSVSVMVTY